MLLYTNNSIPKKSSLGNYSTQCSPLIIHYFEKIKAVWGKKFKL